MRGPDIVKGFAAGFVNLSEEELLVTGAAVRERLAGAFQDFFKFEFLATNTVGLGDLPRIDDRPAVDWVAGNTWEHYAEHIAWINQLVRDSSASR